jgi:ABC-type antimicrobial peptide transport system permease subunit
MDRMVGYSTARQRFYAVLLGVFAAVAGLLAAIGIYGVLAYSVVQRTQEIGIRMALGARPGAVRLAVIRSGMSLALFGLLGGVASALALSRLLGGLTYGIGPADPLTLAAVTLLFGGVALLACWLPARRASKLDPLEALRAE